MTATTATVTSADGTTIAYEYSGQGPALVVVDGALCHRGFGPARPLAQRLTGHFTVYTYDRRGRGDSTDTAPYSPEREYEDLAAVVAAAGGRVFLYGTSSGAALALEFAHRNDSVAKLALFEAPFIVDDSKAPSDIRESVDRAIGADRRGEALSLFMRFVGMPGFALAIMRLTPVWPKLKTVAPTLHNDIAIVDDYQQGRPLPDGNWNGADMPTLVIDGGKSPAWIRTAARSLAEILPHAGYTTLPGQTHNVKPDSVAPVLIKFFGKDQA